MNLRDIIAEYPLGDDNNNLLMRESIRIKHRKTIRESRAPQSGAYWWFPQPAGNKVKWSVIEFFDSDYHDNTLHMDLWPNVLELLAIKWQKNAKALYRSLSDNYTALPRGRVNAGVADDGSRIPKVWYVVHGNDTPKGASMDSVLVAFNLPAARVKLSFDHHEQMDPEDCRQLQSALGVDLGLKGVDQSELVYSEFDDNY